MMLVMVPIVANVFILSSPFRVFANNHHGNGTVVPQLPARIHR